MFAKLDRLLELPERHCVGAAIHGFGHLLEAAGFMRPMIVARLQRFRDESTDEGLRRYAAEVLVLPT